LINSSLLVGHNSPITVLKCERVSLPL
jgi:hypothetical protein